MATLLILRGQATEQEKPTLGRLAIQLLVLAALTQLVYPLLYNGMLGRHGTAMIIISTVVTTVRNLALVAFTVEVCRLAWRLLAGKDQRASTSAR
jgi:heme/copper-type cytochrome/quinol oxidase subunit 1